MQKILERLAAIGIMPVDIARAVGISRQAFHGLIKRKNYNRAAEYTREAVSHIQGELEEVNRILGELEE